MCGRTYPEGRVRAGEVDDVTCLVCRRQVAARAGSQRRLDALQAERDRRRADDLLYLESRQTAASKGSPIMDFLSDLKDRGWLGVAVFLGLIGWAVADARIDHDTPSRPNQFSPSVDRDCADFSSQSDAQRYYMAQVGDPDGLDRDGDGVACEALP